MKRSSIGGLALGCGCCLALLLGLAVVGSCSKDKGGRGRPEGAATAAPGNPPVPRPMRPRGVAPLPPGAPGDRPLLALPRDHPPKYRWQEHGVWKELGLGGKLAGFALPAAAQRAERAIVRRGWKGAGSKPVERFLGRHKGLLAALTRLPACAPLRKSFTDVMVPRSEPLVVPLKQVATALLLQARRAEHRGAPEGAARLAVAALRLACHMSHVPDVLMKISALAVERQGLHVVGALLKNARSCPRLVRAVRSHGKRRAAASELDTTQWLQIRTSLRYVTAGLKVSKAAGQADRRRLDKLERAIVRSASELYREHALLVRRALVSDADADWKKLDRWNARLSRDMAQLKKRHATPSETELVMLLAKHPKKPVAWTASIVARVFVSMSTMNASLWRPAAAGDRQIRQRLTALAATRCP